MKRLFVILFIIGALAGCSRNSSSGNQEGGFIQMKGSDTLVNAAQMLAEEFMKIHPEISVAVTGGGSGVGIASLINKTCDVANASRDIKQKEIELAQKQDVYPHEITVAFDGVAVLVNKENPISKLTIKQLHDIYTKKVTNWQELGGPDLEIVVISREVSSGTHVYFKEKVIQLDDKSNHEEFASDVLLLSSSQAIVEEVSQNKGAIGYLGMGYISSRTKTLAVSKDGATFYLPDTTNVLTNNYPLARPLFMYTNGEPQGSVKVFFDFILSPKGQEQFAKTGFAPLSAHAETN